MKLTYRSSRELSKDSLGWAQTGSQVEGSQFSPRQVCQVSKAEHHPQFQGRYYYSTKHLSWQTHCVCFQVKIMNVKYSGNTRASGNGLENLSKETAKEDQKSFFCLFLSHLPSHGCLTIPAALIHWEGEHFRPVRLFFPKELLTHLFRFFFQSHYDTEVK